MSLESNREPKAPNKRVQTLWNKDQTYVEELDKVMCSNDVLMEWILVPSNFRAYWGICGQNEKKQKRSVILRQIREHFGQRGFPHRTTKNISSRLGNLFNQYKKYKDMVESSSPNLSLNIEATREVLKDKICPNFDELDALMSDSSDMRIENEESSTQSVASQVNQLEEDEIEATEEVHQSPKPQAPVSEERSSVSVENHNVIYEDTENFSRKKLKIMEEDLYWKKAQFEQDKSRYAIEEKRMNNEQKRKTIDQKVGILKLMLEKNVISLEEFGKKMKEYLDDLEN